MKILKKLVPIMLIIIIIGSWFIANQIISLKKANDTLYILLIENHQKAIKELESIVINFNESQYYNVNPLDNCRSTLYYLYYNNSHFLNYSNKQALSYNKNYYSVISNYLDLLDRDFLSEDIVLKLISNMKVVNSQLTEINKRQLYLNKTISLLNSNSKIINDIILKDK